MNKVPEMLYYLIILFLLEFINNSQSDWISSLILRHSKGIYKSIFPFAGLLFFVALRRRNVKINPPRITVAHSQTLH
jgi:hypothetical protein